jgi:hypothetical protein
MALGAPCLEADLVDVAPLAPGLQFECVIAELRNLGEPDQEERLLPACGPDTGIPCFEIAEDRESCPDTLTGLTLVIERGGLSVPPGTHVQARCRTRCDGDHL